MRVTFLLATLLFSPSVLAVSNWFSNQAQQAEQAYQQGEYQQAADLFDDPYQRGVALYRAGQYEAAAAAFAEVQNPTQQLKAGYNQGNSYFQQEDYASAIKHYEAVLKQQPDHADAQHNLALAQQKLAEQQQQEQQQNPQNEGDSSQEAEQQNQQNQQAESEQNNSQQADSDDNSQQSPADSSSEQQSAQANENNDASQSPDQQQAQAKPQDEAKEQTQPQQAEAQEPADTAEDATAQHSAGADMQAERLESEREMRADALLNRLKSNPSDILRSQFYIDAVRSEAERPEQTW